MVDSIRLDGSIMESKAYQNAARFKIFVTLLLLARQQQGGAIVTSLARLAKQSLLAIKQVRNALAALVKARLIVCSTTHCGTVVTICNYETYKI